MILDVRGASSHRHAYLRAKREFVENPIHRYRSDSEFWEEFGKVIGATIVFDGWTSGFPMVTTLKFNDDKAAAWFILRWS